MDQLFGVTDDLPAKTIDVKDDVKTETETKDVGKSSDMESHKEHV